MQQNPGCDTLLGLKCTFATDVPLLSCWMQHPQFTSAVVPAAEPTVGVVAAGVAALVRPGSVCGAHGLLHAQACQPHVWSHRGSVGLVLSGCDNDLWLPLLVSQTCACACVLRVVFYRHLQRMRRCVAFGRRDDRSLMSLEYLLYIGT